MPGMFGGVTRKRRHEIEPGFVQPDKIPWIFI